MPGETPKRTPFGFLEDADQLLSDFPVFHKKNIMATAGGWRDQSATWRDGMLTLSAMYAEEYERIRKLTAGRR